MHSKYHLFDEHHVLHTLKHYLPAQAPLKDFIHHNTLHAFQHLKFHEARTQANEILGFKVSLKLEEFRQLYHTGRIHEAVLDRVILKHKADGELAAWKEKMLASRYTRESLPRVGALRANWKKEYHIDIDSLVHPILFRILCHYLDQGISIWNFPVRQEGFLASIQELERKSFISFFRKNRARQLLLNSQCEIKDLLKLLVGDESLFEHYLFDQQFAHQGWSGMVSTVEDHPETLLDQRLITLRELVQFELLLEIDALDYLFGEWQPLASKLKAAPTELFAEVKLREIDEVLILWQEAFEWSYYDEVLAGLQHQQPVENGIGKKSFQSFFCIDDRECSIRRYLEKLDPACQTFGTPGFFGVEFFYQPEHGKFYTKLCPAPVTPKYLIKEVGTTLKHETDAHLTKHSYGLIKGWLISQTLGFWSAWRLFLNIFRPTMSPATASSLRHMDKNAMLTVENKNFNDRENDLQIGFTIDEMVVRVEGVLKSTGLISDFAPLVYVVGHGSSSVNNPHYAAYDCGACSGRAGSVNSRVFCYMANHTEVRRLLQQRGVDIPPTTQFVGALHDTTRDEVVFFDEDQLLPENLADHKNNQRLFNQALDLNAKERSRRFMSINSKLTPSFIHEKIKIRSVSLFEPRPELNHATNALCVIGRRDLTKHLFLDRRAFMNSFDYTVDPEGNFLLNIVKAAAPVCGGINLEYFFSRVDNQKLGAGTKLPHNVMGLIGVANGIDGDLRPGLPSQMIEVHDPVRLLMVIEHFPDVVLQTIERSKETYEWFVNEWVHLVVIHPETRMLHRFSEGTFVSHVPYVENIPVVKSIDSFVEATADNIPVMKMV